MEGSDAGADDRAMNRGPSFLISLLMIAAALLAGPALAAAPPEGAPCDTASATDVAGDCANNDPSRPNIDPFEGEIDLSEREFVTND